MSAYEDLMEYLEHGETVEAIVFGEWGWSGYEEPNPAPVPESKRGIVLSLNEARYLMYDWSFYGGFGAPECYAVNIWTDRRVIFVAQYDGATSLESVTRNPGAILPDMPGG